MKLGISVEGADTLRRQFEGLRRRASGKPMADSVEAGLEAIRERARELAPVLTGALRDGIDTDVATRGDQAEGRLGWRKEVAYGVVVELKQKPHLRPAYDERRHQAVRDLGRKFEEEVIEPVVNSVPAIKR